MIPRPAAVAAAVACLGASLVAAACSTGGDEPTPIEAATVRVGAFNFSESELIAEIYAQALEARDIPVERLGPIGSREVVQPALELGLVDVVPEYAGTMLSFVSLGAIEPTLDSDATVDELRATLGPRGMVALDPADAQNRNVVVVTRTFAEQHGLRDLSDLTPIASELTFGGPSECSERPFCLLGLRDTYGIEFERFVPMPSSAVVAQGLQMGEIDVGLMFSTDPSMVDTDFTLLHDDRGLQPSENVVPVVRWDVFYRWAPRLGDALNDVSSRLETFDLASLNLRSLEPDADISELARGWLAG